MGRAEVTSIIVTSIDAAKKLVELLGSTVDYMLGETKEGNIFKHPQTLQRFNSIISFKAE